MRKKVCYLCTMFLTTGLLLTACEGTAGGDGKPGLSDGGKDTGAVRREDGAATEAGDTYTPPEGDAYLGLGYYFADNEGYEFRTICGDDMVIDCGASPYLDTFDEEYYYGMSPEYAFSCFYENNIAPIEREKGERIARLEAILGDQNSYEDYREIYENVKDKFFSEAELHSILERQDAYADGVAQSAVNNEAERQRRAVEKELENVEAERAAEEERRREEEPKPASNEAELIAEIEKHSERVTLSADIVIDVSAYTYDRVTIDCENHAVTVKGTWGSVPADKIEGGVGLCLMNASSVDLQGLVVSEDCFGDIQNVIGKNYVFVMVQDTDPDQVVFPAGLNPNDWLDLVPMEGRLTAYVNAGDRHASVGYSGPETSYEERNELETEMVKEILINGDLDDFQGADVGVMPEIWTDVVIDIGSVTLPNQDYQRVVVKPGGSLKISGSIAITGGRLDWDISESGQLDITGLTLTKKHPSPDMFKIRFPAGTAIDESTLHCKASSGTIKYTMGTESFDITIW